MTGVLPDIVLPSVLNYSKLVGENSLDNPLKGDSIPPADYSKLNLVDPYLPELVRESNERIATNQDYNYVREDIERFRKEQDDKTISLNEQSRLKDMEEAEARSEARDKERKLRKSPRPTVYEVSLADVDKPGLPVPVGQTNLTSTANSDPHTTTVSVHGTEAVTENGESTALAVDPMMDEAERIMKDYIGLLRKDGVAIAKSDVSAESPAQTVVIHE